MNQRLRPILKNLCANLLGSVTSMTISSQQAAQHRWRAEAMARNGSILLSVKQALLLGRLNVRPGWIANRHEAPR